MKQFQIILALSLSALLLLCAPISSAYAQANPEIANCEEIKDEATATQRDFCIAHVGCRLVFSVIQACTKAKAFLGRLKETVGEGARTLFGRNREVSSNHVFDALVTPEIEQATSKDGSWRRTAQSIAENVNKAPTQTAAGGEGKDAWAFVGEVREGIPNGWGTRFTANGSVERGQFTNGKANGQADVIAPDTATRSTGTFQFGDLNGRAFAYAKGETYVGSFRENKRDGFGTLTAQDGSRYEGSFSDNGISGAGTRYRADGTVEERGVFGKNGQLTSGQRLDAKGSVVETLGGTNIYAQAEQINKVEQDRLRVEAEAKRKRDEEVAERRRAADLAKQEAIAREQREFQARLDNDNPGQLFALADELAAKGDTGRAAQVRRALVSKYPNHPLAATAAQQMAAISTSGANPGGGGGPAGQGGAGGGSAPPSGPSVEIPCGENLDKYLNSLPSFRSAGLRNLVSQLRSAAASELGLIASGRMNASSIKSYQQRRDSYRQTGQQAMSNHRQLAGAPNSAMCNPAEGSQAFAWAATQLGFAYDTWVINQLQCRARGPQELIPQFCPF